MNLTNLGTKTAFSAFFVFFLLIGGVKSQPVLDSQDKLAPTQAKTSINPNELFQRISATSDTVKDMSAKVSVGLLLNSTITFNLTGNFYYEQPDKMKLELNGIPQFLASRQDQGFKTAQILSSLRKDITKDYDARLINEIEMEGEPCYAVSLTPKNPGDIGRILVWINADNYTIPQLILSYKDGETVTQRKQFVKVDGVYVVNHMETDYTTDGMRAEITADFKNYRVNQGIPDGVFDNSPGANTPINAF